MDDAPARPQMQPDLAMAVGECRIECQGTVIDVGLKGAWERVVEHLIRQAPDQDHQRRLSVDLKGANSHQNLLIFWVRKCHDFPRRI